MRTAILAVLAAVVALAGCTPGYSVPQGFNAVLPTELKDCKIFRISDGTQALYITRCPETTTTATTAKSPVTMTINNSGPGQAVVDEHAARVDAMLKKIDEEIARLEAKKKDLK